MESEPKRGVIGLLVVFLAATGASALVFGITDSALFSWMLFLVVFFVGVFKGDNIARYISGK